VPYTIGTVRHVSGSGTFDTANLAGLQVLVTNVPATAGVQVGNPPRYHGLGHVALGNSDGWGSPISIAHIPHLINPIPDVAYRVGYSFQAGVLADITTLLGVTPTVASADPWDRSASSWVLQAVTAMAGGIGQAQAWTYTVPTGRKLMLSQASAALQRTVAATSTSAYVYAQLLRNESPIVEARMVLGAVGTTDRHVLGAPLVLLPGEVLRAIYGNYDTGGNVISTLLASGLTFNA
jgi:hypothetical protein